MFVAITDRGRTGRKDVMPTEVDVAVVRRFYAALAAGDLASAGKCFREDAVWHLPGSSRIAGTHRGWPAIRDDFLAKLSSLSGGTFRAPVLDLAVGTEYIVAVGKGIAEHAGRRLDVTVCQLMRVQDGKIVEVRGHYSDQAALDAFWGT
jgi:ketosteroid isomerase-like protein